MPDRTRRNLPQWNPSVFTCPGPCHRTFPPNTIRTKLHRGKKVCHRCADELENTQRANRRHCATCGQPASRTNRTISRDGYTVHRTCP